MSTQTQPYTGSRFSAKTLTMCAIFTALVAVCSQITIPLPIIPINLALFAVYLAGTLARCAQPCGLSAAGGGRCAGYGRVPGRFG